MPSGGTTGWIRLVSSINSLPESVEYAAEQPLAQIVDWLVSEIERSVEYFRRNINVIISELEAARSRPPSVGDPLRGVDPQLRRDIVDLVGQAVAGVARDEFTYAVDAVIGRHRSNELVSVLVGLASDLFHLHVDSTADNPRSIFEQWAYDDLPSLCDVPNSDGDDPVATVG